MCARTCSVRAARYAGGQPSSRASAVVLATAARLIQRCSRAVSVQARMRARDFVVDREPAGVEHREQGQRLALAQALGLAVFVADAANDGLEAFDKLPPCGRLGEGVFGEHVESPPEFVEERAAEHREHRAHEHLAQVGGRQRPLRRAANDALRPRAALVVDGPCGDDERVSRCKQCSASLRVTQSTEGLNRHARPAGAGEVEVAGGPACDGGVVGDRLDPHRRGLKLRGARALASTRRAARARLRRA